MAGVVLAIKPDGDLLWYRYTDDGTADQTGATAGSPTRVTQSVAAGRTSSRFLTDRVALTLSAWSVTSGRPSPR